MKNAQLIRLILVVALLMFGTARAEVATGPFVDDEHTIGLWHLDESSGDIAFDESSNNSHGLVGGPVWDSDGQFGGCLFFDGENDSLRIDLNQVGFINSKYTVEIFVNPSSMPTSEWSTIWSFYGESQQMPLKLWPDGRISYRIIENDFLYDEIFSTTRLETGNWYHVVCQYDGDIAILQIDGVIEGSLHLSYTPETLTYSVMDIGKMRRGSIANPSHSNWFDGRIDEIRISDAARYEESGETPFLVGHWSFDESSGSTVHDASSYANHGQATGTDIVPGCDNNGRHFSSTADYITIPHGPQYDFEGDFSIAAKVRLDYVPPVEGKILLKFSSYSSTSGITMSVGRFGQVSFAIVDNTAGNRVNSIGTLEPARCYCIVAMRRGSDLKVYIDGELDNTTSGASTKTLDDPADITVGYRNLGNDQNFPGVIDDLRLFNYALYTAEIDDICGGIYVGDNDPSAVLAATVTSNGTPLVVSFDAGGSADPDGDITTYAYDFESDGIVDAVRSTPDPVQHTYIQAGVYTASVKVSDSRGNYSSDDVKIRFADFRFGRDNYSFSNSQSFVDYANSFLGAGGYKDNLERELRNLAANDPNYYSPGFHDLYNLLISFICAAGKSVTFSSAGYCYGFAGTEAGYFTRPEIRPLPASVDVFDYGSTDEKVLTRLIAVQNSQLLEILTATGMVFSVFFNPADLWTLEEELSQLSLLNIRLAQNHPQIMSFSGSRTIIEDGQEKWDWIAHAMVAYGTIQHESATDILVCNNWITNQAYEYPISGEYLRFELDPFNPLRGWKIKQSSVVGLDKPDLWTFTFTDPVFTLPQDLSDLLAAFVQTLDDISGSAKAIVVKMSPGDILVRNSSGERTGFVDGLSLVEIDSALTKRSGDFQFLQVPLDQDYEFSYRSSEEGMADLVILLLRGDSTYSAFSYKGITVQQGMRANGGFGPELLTDSLVVNLDQDELPDTVLFPDIRLANKCAGCGLITGKVTSEDTPIAGVGIDVYDGNGTFIQMLSTDEDGVYCSGFIDSGNYFVGLVTPLGYECDQEYREVEVGNLPTETSFALDQLDIPAQQRSRGYWAHQLHKALQGKPKDYAVDDFANFARLIDQHFNQNDLNPVDFYTVPQPASQADSLEVLTDLLHMRNGEDWQPILQRLAKAQLMALMLNVVSGKVHQTYAITDDGRTVSQLITYCDMLVNDEIMPPDESGCPGYGSPWFRYIYASFMLVKANLGLMVPAGMIPEDVIQIAYKNVAEETLPIDFELGQNYPNPFNPETEISFSLPSAGQVKLEVFNIMGQSVATLVDENLSAGRHSVRWLGTDSRDRSVPSGIYLYRITAGEFTDTKKMLLLK